MSVVILDACVLYPPSLRDFLMWLAVGSVFEMRLTEAIHDEWIHNALENNRHLTREHLERTRTFENIIPSLTLPDADDRHVLAAAIRAQASAIVTFNLRDFPDSSLKPYSIQAQHPDVFVTDLMNEGGIRRQVIAMARKGRQNLKNPPKSVEDYLESLRQNRMVRTVSVLSQYASEL